MDVGRTSRENTTKAYSLCGIDLYRREDGSNLQRVVEWQARPSILGNLRVRSLRFRRGHDSFICAERPKLQVSGLVNHLTTLVPTLINQASLLRSTQGRLINIVA
jgi:hypothetical protein